MTPRAKAILKTAAKLAVSVTAMTFVLRAIDWPTTKGILLSSNLALLGLAVVFYMLSKVSSAFRLQLYFKNINLVISHLYNLRLAWLGMFYNLFLPGGIGGDGYKVYLLHRQHSVPVKKVAAAVLIDRISGMAVLTLLALVGASLLDIPSWPSWVPWACRALALLALPALYVLKVWMFPSFRRHFLWTTLFSFGTQCSQLVCAFFILRALGVDDQFLEYEVLFLVSSVVVIWPFTIGGVGARELTFILSYQYLGIDKNVSVAFSLLIFMVTVFISMFGFLFDLKTDDRPRD